MLEVEQVCAIGEVGAAVRAGTLGKAFAVGVAVEG